MKTPEQQAQEWAFNESANLDIDCPIITSGNDEELCSECRHIYWAAVRGYIAGHAAGKQDERSRIWAECEKRDGTLLKEWRLGDIERIVFNEGEKV